MRLPATAVKISKRLAKDTPFGLGKGAFNLLQIIFECEALADHVELGTIVKMSLQARITPERRLTWM